MDVQEEKHDNEDKQQLDPFDILQIQKGATNEEIKKQFHKLQLKYHPDRKTGCLEAYQKIVAAYKAIETKQSFLELYRSFKSTYLDSEEEFNDLAKLYTKYKGDIVKIIDNHILCEYEDEERVRRIVGGFIAEKRVRKFKAFDAKIKKRRKGKMDDKALEELAAVFAKNEEKRLEVIKKLEDKYSKQLK